MMNNHTDQQPPKWQSLIVLMVSFVLQNVTKLLPITMRRTRCLIRCGDEVLLIRNRIDYRYYTWTLPGGGCKPKESAQECAKREIYEELHLATSPSQWQQLADRQRKHGLMTEILLVFTTTFSKKPELKLNKFEILSAQWFQTDQLPEKRNPIIDHAIAQAHFKS